MTSMNKEELLEEYCNIRDQLNKMKNTFELINYETKLKSTYASSEQEKQEILQQHKNKLIDIQNDKQSKIRYKTLKKKQELIKKILVDDNKIYEIKMPDIIDNKLELSTNINSLIQKYKS